MWRAAHAYLVGADPYPTVAAVLHSVDPHPAGPAGELFVYPLPVAALLSPLGAVPYPVAAAIFTVASIAAVLLALRLLGVRDWRCYGIAFATPATMTAVSWGTLTPFLLLAVAAAWRYRDSVVRCGLAVALAVVAKVFLWPLVLWLVLTRRFRAGAVAGGATMLLVLASWSRIGFSSLIAYPRSMRDLAHVQAPRGETLSAVVGTSGTLWALTLLAAAGAAALWWRLRDERVAFASLVLLAVWLSPIAWIHYFALVFPLIALWTPRLTPAWLVPLAFWLTLSQQPHQPWRVAIALLASAAAVAAARGIPKGPGRPVLSGIAPLGGGATIRP